MEEYSYISENGTVRQIRDLIAKAKDAEQDAEILELQQKVQQGWELLASGIYSQVTDIPLAHPVTDYKSLLVVCAMWYNGTVWQQQQTMEIPYQIYFESAANNRQFAFMNRDSTGERDIYFNLDAASPSILRINFVSGYGGASPAIRRVFGKK